MNADEHNIEASVDLIYRELGKLLAEGAREIHRRNHAFQFYMINQPTEDATSPECERRCRIVAKVMQALTDRGVEPFATLDLFNFPPTPIPKFEDLPSEFHYLIEPALRYGHFDSDVWMAEIADMNEADRAELDAFARRYSRDFWVIEAWANERKFSPEFNCLTALGLFLSEFVEAFNPGLGPES